MSWSSYVTTLMNEGGPGVAADAAIVCYTPGTESVWAAETDGTFKAITTDEVKKLVRQDRSTLFTDGVTLAGQRCRVLLDDISKSEGGFMNLATTDGHTICVAKAKQVLVMLKGCKSIHGGQLLPKVTKIAEYLASVNF